MTEMKTELKTEVDTQVKTEPMAEAIHGAIPETIPEAIPEAIAGPLTKGSGSQASGDASGEGAQDRDGASRPIQSSLGEPGQDKASDEPTARGATVPLPMTKRANQPAASEEAKPADAPSSAPTGPPPKSPLAYLSGSLTSALMAWLCLLFSQRVVIHFSLHPPHYSARIAHSIATALKTLIVGMGFLSTFSCAFVALGLFLVFIRSLSRAEAPGAS